MVRDCLRTGFQAANGSNQQSWRWHLSVRRREIGGAVQPGDPAQGYGTSLTTMHILREADVRALLGIPETAVQACLLPVARLRPGTQFRAAPRRPIEEVVVIDGWGGPPS